jgi:ring-1,2-phenylacetyl-CoA epoxidase subunit PaaD
MSALEFAEPHTEDDLVAVARAAVEQVCDPEIPVLTIADLGVLRSVDLASDGAIDVAITPTYSGCPAMDVIGFDIKAALIKAGIDNARIRQVLSPAWTTDWMSEAGKAKLRAYGIAPPAGRVSRRALFGEESVACPRCDSQQTEKVSEFGSTACKALWRCTTCREPFDYFKCI